MPHTNAHALQLARGRREDGDRAVEELALLQLRADAVAPLTADLLQLEMNDVFVFRFPSELGSEIRCACSKVPLAASRSGCIDSSTFPEPSMAKPRGLTCTNRRRNDPTEEQRF